VITCEQFLAGLGDYVEGDITSEMRDSLERHLSQCRLCQVLYDSTRKTLTIVTESGSFELLGDVSESMVARIMAKVRRGAQ
jgi:hypothetical protein